MSTTILVKAQTNDIPTYTELPFCYFDAPTSGDTVRKVLIEVTNPPTSYDIEYSINGTDWHEIATGVVTATYEWALTNTQQGVIFGNEAVQEVIVRVLESSVELERDTKNFALLSFVNLTPSSGDIIHEADSFLINFAESYATETGTVDVYMKRASLSSWRKIYDNVPANIKSLPFGFKTYRDLDNSYFTAGNGFFFHVLVQGNGDHASNYVIGSSFAVTDVVQPEHIASASTYYSDEAFRIGGGRRVAAEKAELLDEVPILGQFEKGAGINIKMRNTLGKLTDDPEEPVNYKKARNLVIEVDPDTIPIVQAGREFVSRISFGTWGTPLGTDVTPSPSPYINDVTEGKLYRINVAHNFDLVDKTAIDVELHPITDHTLTTDLYPENSTLGVWEVLDKDTISVFAVLRNPTGMGDGYPTNAICYKVGIRERVNVQ